MVTRGVPIPFFLLGDPRPWSSSPLPGGAGGPHGRAQPRAAALRVAQRGGRLALGRDGALLHRGHLCRVAWRSERGGWWEVGGGSRERRRGLKV